jgi:hypothetical protein
LALFSCAIAFLLPNINQDVVVDEDIRFRNYLAANGYNTAQLGIHEPTALAPNVHPQVETTKLD